MKNYILDTSAILTFIENEAGVEDVEKLLLDAVESKIQIFISAISTIELYYISLREQGKKTASNRWSSNKTAASTTRYGENNRRD